MFFILIKRTILNPTLDCFDRYMNSNLDLSQNLSIDKYYFRIYRHTHQDILHHMDIFLYK